jgi:TPR repeat protein
VFGIAIAQLKPACSTGRRRRDGGRVRGRSLCKRAAKAVDAKALGYRYEHCRDVAAVLREAFHWLVEARGTRGLRSHNSKTDVVANNGEGARLLKSCRGLDRTDCYGGPEIVLQATSASVLGAMT